MAGYFNRLRCDNKGAASVLVIFLMLVFVTLGAFAITSANANYKLSQRARQWNEMYYSLDAKGEEYIALIDSKLLEAEEMAYNYMMEEMYKRRLNADIPEQMQADIYRDFIADKLDAGKTINNIYMHYANIYLNSLANSELEVYTMSKGYLIDGVLAKINIKSDKLEDELCGLNISVSASAVDYNVMQADGKSTPLRANDDLRYNIEDWHEYQEAEEEASSEDFWDGSL